MASKSPIQDVGIMGALHTLEQASRVPNVERKDLKSILGRNNWKAGHNPDLDEAFKRRRGHTEIIDAGMISRLSTAAHELDNMRSILKHLTDVATELSQEYKDILGPIVPKLSKGISHLPDEILAMVFKWAVHAEGHRGGEQARYLSHVSRTFRAISIVEHDLWTTFCSSSSREELEMLVSRSGTQTDLHIFINIPTSRSPWDFVEICSRFYSRWKTMQIGNFPRGHHPKPILRIDPNSDIYGHVSYEMRMFLNAFGARHSSLPRLVALDFDFMHHRAVSSSFPWETPNLQSLRCAQYLPLSPTALSSVTTFVCVLHLKSTFALPARMQELLDLLTSLTSLTDFDLGLGNVDTDLSEGTLRPPASGCPFVKRFCLRLLALNLYGGRKGSVGQFLCALRFPNLEDYSFSIEFLDAGGEKYERTERLEVFPSELLPHEFGRTCSRLATLSVQVSVTVSCDRAPGIQGEEIPVIFPIYINNVPTISTLNVTARSCAVLIRDGRASIDERYPQARVTPLKHRPIQLQEIRFLDCEHMEVDDLQNIVRYLKKDGYWEQLDRVTMKNCGLLKYENARQVLGEKDLVYSQSM
ncbi:hypothetical protein SCHPADRAFT_944579 [Schizopora paradoxa]|uniref:Uncharacterized protein n=1 Tax=Schizopora paradoxa TaxID=27342 RepID=A0A0H2R8W7_9AGAM|nr:hypothetical protein SCHPADRAFT_944579 [Schizopora paradoxa]